MAAKCGSLTGSPDVQGTKMIAKLLSNTVLDYCLHQIKQACVSSVTSGGFDAYYFFGMFQKTDKSLVICLPSLLGVLCEDNKKDAAFKIKHFHCLVLILQFFSRETSRH